MKKIILASLMALSFTSLQAKECFNSNSIDVTWVSYKTMAKIGVGGDFSKVHLSVANANATSVAKMLKGSSVKLSLGDIDAHMALKNQNIAKFFTANLSTKNITAKIISADTRKLLVSITLNGKTQNIPMSYMTKESHIVATGVIDAIDFDIVPALRTLNKNVAGHKNKGWNDISIAFDMPYTSTCK